MKRKVKLLTIIIFLLFLIFLFLIRLNYPLKVSTTESIFHMVPIYYWILMLTIPALICITFILTESKKVCIFLAVLYFFVLYSLNLFFVIPSTQSDVGAAGLFFTTLKDSTTLSIEQLKYFQWPIHFLFDIILIKTLGVGISSITLGLFSFILTIPLFLILFVDEKSNNKVYFLLPVGYIIFSFYLINLQWVPQFTGLIFLISTIGCYTKYKKEENSRKFYALTVLFYTICVFTHGFMFVFFPAAIILNRYIVPKNLFNTYNEKNNKISLIMLGIIYLGGYLFRFAVMGKHTRRLIYPEEGRGGAWRIIGYLFGTRGGLDNGLGYETYRLYHLVSRRTYLISRYAAQLLLVIIVLLLGYILLKNLKKVNSFDISLSGASVGFFLFGLVNPALLGQRAFQVAFLKVPRYFSNLFEAKRKILTIVLVLAIILAPLLFTINTAVNHSQNGGKFIQDPHTLNSGRFVDNNVGNNSNVLVADRFFYPSRRDEFNVSVPRLLAEKNGNLTEVNMVVHSPKLTNRMEFYGLEAEYGETSQIYDNGGSQVLIKNS